MSNETEALHCLPITLLQMRHAIDHKNENCLTYGHGIERNVFDCELSKYTGLAT